MVEKRSFDQELSVLSSKQPRLVSRDEQITSLGFSHDQIAINYHSLGEGEEDISFQKNFTSDNKFDGGCTDDFQSSERDIEPGIPPGSFTSITHGDIKSECPYDILLSPEHYNLNVSRSKLIYSTLIRSPPQKPVPLGPDHQAELPDLLGQEQNESSQTSDSHSNAHFTDENRLCGTCIIPMPKQDSSGYNEVSSHGIISSSCLCEDAGSIRCIRQHNSEAREKLKRMLGEEIFEKLGFYDMGEVVALRWSEEEQELFHDVVFSNPASLGKNFWDNLGVEFPSRTRKQIVSYYFNVFMLRRRAEQNRFDPLNIDSDNDEWHANMESSVDEAKMSDDENSHAESPIYLDDDHHPDDDRSACNQDISNLANMPNNHEQTLEHHPESKWTLRDRDRVILNGDGNCNDVVIPQEAHVKGDVIKDWRHSLVGMGSGENSGHDCVLDHEHCIGGKEWDIGFFSCSPKCKVDFLPTCSMREEFFGDNDWNYPK
ncbi:unnamed protein product [Cuscuta europaea]|uniref:Myb-like domain-containing protein n=1 Tax=Cuscuta europaea TaxID=41803 RepID=A0A9P0YX62_CUSEU|nr:unnamed protein product [Cuscuta europaea]